MKISARIAEKFSLFNPPPRPPRRPLPVPKTRRVSFPRQSGAKGWSSVKRVSVCLNVRNQGVFLGAVRPANEAYADEAIEALGAGKVVAVPTDTLYGFACDACSKEAIQRIYEIKGRVHTKPLAICVGDVSDIKRFVVVDHLPHGLLDSLLPGPVTIVLRRGESSELEKSLNPNLESMGVRVPDSDFIRAIAHGLGRALALTSANLSGKPSSICVNDFENLWDQCEHVYDGGVLASGRAGSTVVDLTSPGTYKIIRPGSAMEETARILHKHLLAEAPVTS